MALNYRGYSDEFVAVDWAKSDVQFSDSDTVLFETTVSIPESANYGTIVREEHCQSILDHFHHAWLDVKGNGFTSFPLVRKDCDYWTVKEDTTGHQHLVKKFEIQAAGEPLHTHSMSIYQQMSEHFSKSKDVTVNPFADKSKKKKDDDSEDKPAADKPAGKTNMAEEPTMSGTTAKPGEGTQGAPAPGATTQGAGSVTLSAEQFAELQGASARLASVEEARKKDVLAFESFRADMVKKELKSQFEAKFAAGLDKGSVLPADKPRLEALYFALAKIGDEDTVCFSEGGNRRRRNIQKMPCSLSRATASCRLSLA